LIASATGCGLARDNGGPGGVIANVLADATRGLQHHIANFIDFYGTKIL
jgi:hypothetical protein